MAVEFELFIDRLGDERNEIGFGWELNEMVEQTDQRQPIYQGVAPYNQSAFVYDTMCIPRGSCFEFFIGYPSNLTDGDKVYERSPYSVRLDGVIYREDKLGMGRRKEDQTVKLGTNCTIDSSCDQSTENLIELKFKVNPEVITCQPYYDELNYKSAVSGSDFRFWLMDQDSNGYDDYYVTSTDYEDFEVGASYTYIGCIPNKRCAIFFDTNMPASFTIFQDGVEMTKRTVHTEESSLYKGTTTINLGLTDVCSSGLALQLSQGLLAFAFALTVYF